MSLVANYSDSDDNSASDSECAPDQEKQAKVTLDQPDEKSCQIESDDSGGKGANLLLPSASDSSDSDSDDCSKSKQNKLLANPFRTLGDVNVAKEDSVFRNPFRDKEDERIAVLEHHVKMTENPQTSLLINGKKICWNYRKRKCYLGTQCPYAHDTDVPLTEEQLKEQKQSNDLHRSSGSGGNSGTNQGLVGSLTSASQTKSHLPGTASVVNNGYDSSAFFSSPHLGGGGRQKQEDTEDLDSSDKRPFPNSKKKRPGLNNSLIPSKKALMMYHRTKDK